MTCTSHCSKWSVPILCSRYIGPLSLTITITSHWGSRPPEQSLDWNWFLWSDIWLQYLIIWHATITLCHWGTEDQVARPAPDWAWSLVSPADVGQCDNVQYMWERGGKPIKLLSNRKTMLVGSKREIDQSQRKEPRINYVICSSVCSTPRPIFTSVLLGWSQIK